MKPVHLRAVSIVATVAVTLLFSATLSSPAQSAAFSPEVKKYVKVDAPAVLLTHVRIIDGTGAAPSADQSILIEHGKISRISAASTPGELPAGTQTLDLAGDTVLPGLVGMHDHLYYLTRPDLDITGASESPIIVPQLGFTSPRLYLASGVTTLRTTGSIEPYFDLNLRTMIDSGRLPGPHLDVTGPYLEGPGAFALEMHQLKDPADARATVDFWAAQGVTSFKAYMNITRAELKAAIDEAHAKGIKLTGHLCSVTYPEAAEMGIDNLEHGFFVNTQLDPGKQPDLCPRSSGTPTLAKMTPDSPEAKALFALLIAHHVAITSTLPVFESDDPGHLHVQPRVLEAMSPPTREAYLTTRSLELQRAATDPKAAAERAGLFKNGMAMERAFVAAGGVLLAGPDPTGDGGTLPGFGDQRELELLVEAGFTPVEAIHIGTLNGATYMGREAEIGSIATGKNADLVVVQGDPSSHIADIENVQLVFKDGIGYDSAKLLDSVKGRYGQY